MREKYLLIVTYKSHWTFLVLICEECGRGLQNSKYIYSRYGYRNLHAKFGISCFYNSWDWHVHTDRRTAHCLCWFKHLHKASILFFDHFQWLKGIQRGWVVLALAIPIDVSSQHCHPKWNALFQLHLASFSARERDRELSKRVGEWKSASYGEYPLQVPVMCAGLAVLLQ